MKTVLKIKQQDTYDCGAACLCSISAWYGIRPSLAKTRKACGCTQEGITIKGIIIGARELGLTGKGYKSPDKDISPLINLSAPIIAHIKTKEGMLHFVVICRVTRKHIIIMDPAEGCYKKVNHQEFRELWSGHIIVFSSTDRIIKEKNKNHVIYKLLSIIAIHKKELCLAAIGSIVLSIIGVSNSFFLQQLIDKAIPNGNRALLIFVSLVIFALLILGTYLGYARTMYLIRNSIKIDAILILGYIRKVFKLPVDFFKQYSCGDINSRIDDAFKIRIFISDGLISIFISIVTFLATIILMFIYYSKLATMVLIFIPCYLIIYFIANKINKKYNRELAVVGSKFDSCVIDSLQGAMEVKHLDISDIISERIEEKYITMADKILQASKSVNILGTATDTLSKGLLVMVLISGGFAVFNSNISIGELVSFYTLCSFFTTPLDNLININNTITQAIVSSDRMFEIMELNEEDSTEKNNTIPINSTKEFLKESQDIIINNISFSYIGRNEIFKDLTITIPKGKITAISGDSGCGKSTLASLLLRDYVPTKGSIFINSTNINSLPLNLWRNYITIVPQHYHLFNGTLLDNITCWEENPDIERVLKICCTLGLDYLIKALPLGLLTNTGDGGCMLSGGELQKFSTARAVYKDSKIIIFDESTSSLDSISESFMLEKMIEMRDSGKSIIMITHKLNNLKYADNIIDLNQINKVYTKVEACAPLLQANKI